MDDILPFRNKEERDPHVKLALAERRRWGGAIWLTNVLRYEATVRLLEKVIRQIEANAQGATSKLEECQEKSRGFEIQIAQLKGFLSKYGDHAWSCQIKMAGRGESHSEHPRCDCGWMELTDELHPTLS